MTEATSKSKERVPYNLNVVVPELRELVRGMDAETDFAIDDFVAAYADGVITEAEFRALLVRLVRLLQGAKRSVLIVSLLDESGTESASREVQFQQTQKKAAQK